MPVLIDFLGIYPPEYIADAVVICASVLRADAITLAVGGGVATVDLKRFENLDAPNDEN